MTYTIRTLERADGPGLVALDDYAFVADPDRARAQFALDGVDLRQSGGAFADDGSLAASYVWLDLRLAAPGPLGSVAARPVSGLSWVSVHPDHRRRGLLRDLMNHHIGVARERGLTWPALNASERSIYGRFGYGIASLDVRYTVSRGARLCAAPDLVAAADGIRLSTLMRLDDDATADRLMAIDAACSGSWLGTVTLPDRKARARWRDFPDDRRGSEPLRAVVATREGRDVGYATFQRSVSFERVSPQGSVEVSHLQAADSPTLFALARRFVNGTDLVQTATFADRGFDDPLLWWAGGPRDNDVEVYDALWLRPVDVGAALSERGYAVACDVVLDVTDETCPWNAGTWRLRVGADGVGTCARLERHGRDTAGVPVVALPVQALGAVHLGLRSWASLAVAGDVRDVGGAGGVATLDAAFRTGGAPLGGVHF